MSDPQPLTERIQPGQKAFTLRAVVVGLLLVAGIAALTPINDWHIKNTYFYSQHLPVGIFLLVVLSGLVINPLLGRWRLRAGEQLVIVSMLLVLGGVASSGLTRLLPGNMAGPARVITTTTELTAFVDDTGEVHLPTELYLGFPEKGVPDPNDPDYRYVIDGFHNGLGAGTAVGHRARVTLREGGIERTVQAFEGGGDSEDRLDLTLPVGAALNGQQPGSVVTVPGGRSIEIVRVESPGVPWAAWGTALLGWLPLLGFTFLTAIAMAGVVRKQWIENERLPFPIANAITALLGDPQPGRRLAPIFLSRAFWAGFGVAATVLLSQGLHQLGFWDFPIPTTIDLSQAFAGPPWNQVWGWGIWNWKIFFSIVALTFFLPTDLSFSLWFMHVFMCVTYGVLQAQGVPVQGHHPGVAVIGGWACFCLLILWIGRSYYLGLLRAAFVGTDDPERKVGAFYARLLLASFAGMVGSMVLLGAGVGHAIIAGCVYLGLMLVLARLIAEAGIPFVQWPFVWTPASIIFSVTGFAVPVAALVPLGLLGSTLLGDSRENLLGFAINAEYLGDRAKAPRRRMSAVMLTVLIAGMLIAGATLVYLCYSTDGMANEDGYWKATMSQSLGPIQQAATTRGADTFGETWLCYGIGAAITAVLGVARLLFAWWPLHPIGFLTCASYPTILIWFSFFLGWLAKSLIMRYGGMQLYRSIKPVALGLIAGEAIIAGGFLLLGLFAPMLGIDKASIMRFLPG